MKATNIGVIGCGYWGPNLLRNFAENEGAQLRWICDIDEDRLTSMSRRYPMAQTTADYRVLVSDPALDAVAVVTPVATHFTIAKEFRPGGKNVLLKNPFPATAREAEELIDLAERNGRKIDQLFRFARRGGKRFFQQDVLSRAQQ